MSREDQQSAAIVLEELLDGVKGALKASYTVKPDEVINERPSPNFPEILIDDGRLHYVNGLRVFTHVGDMASDFSVTFSEDRLKQMSPKDREIFSHAGVMTEFVATGEREHAIIVPTALADTVQRSLEKKGLRLDARPLQEGNASSPYSKEYDGDAFRREDITFKDGSAGVAFLGGLDKIMRETAMTKTKHTELT